jgi:hypothetical protein
VFLNASIRLRIGPSQITVYLPENSTLQVTSKTQLPFKQLSTEAREANILPGLTKSLMSINKIAENGNTTIFRPGNEEVTIHKKGTLTITMTKPHMLHGCKIRGAKLWTVSTPAMDNEHKEIANAYNLPSVSQMIKYIHAVAGYPVKDTWIKVIKVGNYYTTWSGLMTSVACKHFPNLTKPKRDI